MRFVAFQTDLFFTDIPDDQLDHWFVGGDCAGWFYARLLPDIHITDHYGPVMEDWGWTMAVKVDDILVWINTWQHLDKDQSWILKKKAYHPICPELIWKIKAYGSEYLRVILKTWTKPKDSDKSMYWWGSILRKLLILTSLVPTQSRTS